MFRTVACMHATATVRRSGFFVVTAVAAAVLLGCGGDDDAAPATPEPLAADDASPDDATPDADASEPATILISGFAFNGPDSVPVGTTVEVRNNDSAPHSWTSTDGVFDSGTLAMSESFTFTFDEPGEYPFFCAIHPSMTGTITVTD